VLAGLLVVLLVEAPDEFLEDRPHGVVVEARLFHRAVAVDDWVRAEVDVGRQELLDERAEGIRLRELRELIPELELLQDVLHVRGEAVQIRLEVGFKLLLAGA